MAQTSFMTHGIRLLCALPALAFGAAAGAAEIENPTGDVAVPAGETLTVRGALAPQGRVTVPATGKLDLKPAKADAEHALPEALRNGLVLWFDGSTNVKTDDGGNVVEWRDVRDSATAEATACVYPRAVFKKDFYDYFDSVAPTVASYMQRDFVDFGDLGSGSWMPFRDSNGALKNLTVKSFFAILRPHPTANVPVGQLMGHTAKSNIYSYNGTQTRWVYTISNAQGALTNAETRIDGKILTSDGAVAGGAVWAKDGGMVHLLSQIGPAASVVWDVDNIGNWLGYHADDKGTGKTGGMYTSGNRVGGPCVGEILMFNRCVTDAERRRIEAYLMNKWFASPTLGSTAVATEGQVSVPESGDATLNDLSGAGVVEKSGSGALTIVRNGGTFEGTVALGAGALKVEQNYALPPLLAKPGLHATAQEGEIGVENGAASGVFAVEGSGTVEIGAVADGVRRVESSAVDLTFRSRGDWTDAAVLSSCYYAQTNTLANGGFESPVLSGTTSTTPPTGWSYVGEAGFVSVIRSDDTLCHLAAATGPVPEGNQFIWLAGNNTKPKKNSEISRTFTIAQTGVYGVRLWHSARNRNLTSSYASRMQIEIDGTNIVDFTVGHDTRVAGDEPTTVPVSSLHTGLHARFLEYEFPTPTLEPGTHTITIREIPTTATYSDACVGFFDDVRILPRQVGRFVWIPNSSFDSASQLGIYQETPNVSRYSINSGSPSNASWTFEVVDSNVASSQPGITQDGRMWLWKGHTNEWTRFADYRKAYMLNSSRISNTVVIPDSGDYTFSVRYSKTDWGAANGDHSCTVTLSNTLDHVVIDLGKFWPKTSDTMRYTKVFTATAGTYVLTFQNTDLPAGTGSGSNGRGTVFDDVTIRYGTDFGRTPTELQRLFVPEMIARDGQLSVKVDLETSGVYRVVAGLAGQPVSTTAVSPSHGFNFYPHVFNVTFDGVTIGRVSVDEPETVSFAFRTPFAAKGSHTIAFVSDATASAPYAQSTVKSVRLDFLAGETMPALDLSDVSLRLSDNAKLNLDFDGTLTVRGVRKDGQSLQGEVSAETAPGLVTGRGKLNIVPHGAVIIFR